MRASTETPGRVFLKAPPSTQIHPRTLKRTRGEIFREVNGVAQCCTMLHAQQDDMLHVSRCGWAGVWGVLGVLRNENKMNVVNYGEG